VQWHWDFFGDAFGGNAPTIPPGGISLSLRYPGQQYDAESGLHYNYFRDYEPGTGRNVESDPVGLGGGANTYGYALQNPLVLFDPDGLKAWYCSRPLNGLPSWSGINHQFICATRPDGTVQCGGATFDPDTDDGNPFSNPGVDSADKFSPVACTQYKDDKGGRCFEDCLLRKIAEPRPRYAIGPQGTDCQEWVWDNWLSCGAECAATRTGKP
jgi:RHS repeat-associated protein